MDDLDDTRAFLRRLFTEAREVTIPADVVPYPELTRAERREHLLTLNECADTWTEVTLPGEVVLDVDGIPIGVSAPRTECVYRAGSVITERDLERAGLTADDVPKLTINPNPNPNPRRTAS